MFYPFLLILGWAVAVPTRTADLKTDDAVKSLQLLRLGRTLPERPVSLFSQTTTDIKDETIPLIPLFFGDFFFDFEEDALFPNSATHAPQIVDSRPRARTKNKAKDDNIEEEKFKKEDKSLKNFKFLYLERLILKQIKCLNRG
jgi:hypothetical protein